MGRAGLLHVHPRDCLCMHEIIFHAIDASFAIKARPDNVICHHKLIKLLLKIIVLESQKISMVLKGVKFLLVAVTGLEERLVTFPYGVKFARKGLKFIVAVQIGTLTPSDVTVELS